MGQSSVRHGTPPAALACHNDWLATVPSVELLYGLLTSASFDQRQPGQHDGDGEGARVAMEGSRSLSQRANHTFLIGGPLAAGREIMVSKEHQRPDIPPSDIR